MKKFTRLTIMLLILAIAITAVPAKTEAATNVPAKVTAALKRVVDDNGRAIVIDHQGEKMYLFKKNCKGKWELKKSFRCLPGDYLRPDRHYHLLRNSDTDKLFYKADGKTYSYGMYIDCYEDIPRYTMRIHSYAEKNGKTYKSLRHNPSGFAVCIDNAYYIWKYYGNGTAVAGC